MRKTLASLAAGPPAGEITAWITLPPHPAGHSAIPPWLDGRLRAALAALGIAELYSHQAECLDLAHGGHDVFITTPTASGKSLCFHLPVFHTLLADTKGTALYLFPTKALAHDQLFALRRLQAAVPGPTGCGPAESGTAEALNPASYDGDTPRETRAGIRSGARIVLTNPEMLHQAILPHHRKWRGFLSALKFVVLDEVHLYRGLFGSHVANLIRRLQRVCRHHGSAPRFICASATVANPDDLGRRLLGREVATVSQNGAPSGEKHVLTCDPGGPLVPATIRWASFLMRQGRQVIVFCQSRLAVERTVAGLRQEVSDFLPSSALHGYRGGYTPAERRRIEAGLRDGHVRAVVGTNALELGVDIGNLDAVLLAGYPGSISATWQRIGRVGRRGAPSLAVLLAAPSPLDRYLIRNPEYLRSHPPEACLLNPDNPVVVAAHARCAAGEIPFVPGERFGAMDAPAMDAPAPAGGDHPGHLPIRPGMSRQVKIVEVSPTLDGSPTLGGADGQEAPFVMHPGAVYLHDGAAYRVVAADLKAATVHVAPDDAGSFSASVRLREVSIGRVLARCRQPWRGMRPATGASPALAGQPVETGYGDVITRTAATLTRERNLPAGRSRAWAHLSLPPEEVTSAGTWLSLPPGTNRLFPPATFAAAWENAGALILAVSPMFLACAAGDLRLSVQCDPPANGKPTLFFVESWPGGLGIAEQMYQTMGEIIGAALRSAARCPCPAGCPTCLPATAGPLPAKHLMLEVLETLLNAW